MTNGEKEALDFTRKDGCERVVDEERKGKKNFERYGKRRKVHAMMARGEKREGGGRR